MSERPPGEERDEPGEVEAEGPAVRSEGIGEDRAGPPPLAVASAEEVAETARDFVSGLLSAMRLEASVGTSVDQGRAFVDVSGDDLGLLIGRRGQTLEALQEITRTAVQRRLRARVRLLVDVEGYRARRRASLADYARAMARRARERGTEIELEPMNAYERKIVHDAIAEVEGASSFSEGEEPNRKVIVRGE
jgi:spoIIIJ-associated protein